jgi:RNA polymerase sigma-70 factor (ECF subfamily)
VKTDPRFEELYRAEFQSVFHTVYALCGVQDVSEEAAQEAFLRAFERWKRLREESWVMGWITTTAINVARRRLRRRAPVELALARSEPEEAIDTCRAVGALPLREQQAVVLYYHLDLPTAEIATAMGCAESSVRVYLARARTALRARLEVTADGER